MALYTAKVHVTGGRAAGAAKSDDGNLELKLALPKELGGAAGNNSGATNPEQLFAAGYGACFDGALNLVARKQGVTLDGTEIDAEVSLDPHGEAFKLAVTLNVMVKGVDQKMAEQLVAKAHEVCPYSNAIRNNVDVTLNVTAA